MAARIRTRTKKYHHITPVLFSSHRLLSFSRIQYKVLLLTCKALNGLAVVYLTDLLLLLLLLLLPSFRCLLAAY